MLIRRRGSICKELTVQENLAYSWQTCNISYRANGELHSTKLIFNFEYWLMAELSTYSRIIPSIRLDKSLFLHGFVF